MFKHCGVIGVARATVLISGHSEADHCSTGNTSSNGEPTVIISGQSEADHCIQPAIRHPTVNQLY